MTRNENGRRRTGFSLVEILVVVAIMSILMALTVAVVSRARISVQYSTVVWEANQLSDACANFNKDFGFYPPSHVLENDNQVAPKQWLRRFQFPTDSRQPEFAILQRMWPRWTPTLGGGGGTTISDAAYTATGLPGVNLDANQCMLFLLGGPNQTGWDPNGPYIPTGTTKKGPYYDFQTNQITGTFPSLHYNDRWGSPYAYFSANAGSDVYSANLFPWPNTGLPTPVFAWGTVTATSPSISGWVASAAPAYVGGSNTVVPSVVQYGGTIFVCKNSNSDAAFTAGNWYSNPNTVTPFFTGNRFANPQKCQVISAGLDKTFGPGGPWTAGQSPYLDGFDPTLLPGQQIRLAGFDDVANFNAGLKLGIPAN